MSGLGCSGDRECMAEGWEPAATGRVQHATQRGRYELTVWFMCCEHQMHLEACRACTASQKQGTGLGRGVGIVKMQFLVFLMSFVLVSNQVRVEMTC